MLELNTLLITATVIEHRKGVDTYNDDVRGTADYPFDKGVQKKAAQK